MVDELKRATTVDEVVRMHNEFLDACLKECLLTNHELIQVRLCVSSASYSGVCDWLLWGY